MPRVDHRLTVGHLAHSRGLLRIINPIGKSSVTEASRTSQEFNKNIIISI